MSKTISNLGIISAFPGCGKSTIYNNAADYGLVKGIDINNPDSIQTAFVSFFSPVCLDSDSSTFDKSKFPQNYIDHMQFVRKNYPKHLMFVSSHDNVREAMAKNEIPYLLVYPDRSLKEDYMQRYKERGSPEGFLKLMDSKWNDFTDSCEQDKTPTKIVLKKGQYLSDVLVEG